MSYLVENPEDRFSRDEAYYNIHERRLGRVVRAPGFSAEDRRFESRSGQDWKTLTVHPAANGYLINFREG